MNDRIAEEIKKRAVNNRLLCREARKIAEELSVPYKEISRIADELKVRITGCELGCF